MQEEFHILKRQRPWREAFFYQMLNQHLIALEKDFVTNGGIKERMHSAGTGYRQQQNSNLIELKHQIIEQEKEIARLRSLLS